VPVAATDRVAVSRAVLLRCSERVGVAVRVGTRTSRDGDSDGENDAVGAFAVCDVGGDAVPLRCDGVGVASVKALREASCDGVEVLSAVLDMEEEADGTGDPVDDRERGHDGVTGADAVERSDTETVNESLAVELDEGVRG
jgi:hypothetical protein